MYLLSSSYRDARIGFRDAATLAKHAEIKGMHRSRECCVPAPWGMEPQEPPAHLETDEELLARRKAILERARRLVADDDS